MEQAAFMQKFQGIIFSIQPFTGGGKTVRQWLSSQSYDTQYKFGIETLKKFGWNIKKIEKACQMFEEAAIKHAKATGNYTQANKSYKIIAKTARFLRETNSIEQLSKLLNNESVGARMWAATYLLPISEHDAMQTLQKNCKWQWYLFINRDLCKTCGNFCYHPKSSFKLSHKWHKSVNMGIDIASTIRISP